VSVAPVSTSYISWSKSRAPWLERLSILLYRLLFPVGLTTVILCWLGWPKLTFRNFTLCRTWLLVWISGVRWSEHIIPVLEDLHWLSVSQRVVFKTDLMVWKCVHGVAAAYLSDLGIPTTAISGRQHLWSAATGTLLVTRTRTATGQRSFAVNGLAIWNRLPPCSTTVTGPVGERLWVGTEDAPVLLDRPSPLRCFHDSGAGYK